MKLLSSALTWKLLWLWAWVCLLIGAAAPVMAHGEGRTL